MAQSNRLNVSLTDALKEKLLKHSAETGMTQNSIISQALVDYFQKYEMVNNLLPAFFNAMGENPNGFHKLSQLINEQNDSN